MIWTHFKSYFCPRSDVSYPCLLFEVPVGGSSWNGSQWSPRPRIRALGWLPPLVCAGPMTSFWQTEYGQRDGMSFPNLSYRSQTSALLTLSPALSIAPLMKPATTSWRRALSGKEPRAASSQQRMKKLRPSSQQPNPLNDHATEPGSTPFPFELSWLQPQWTPDGILWSIPSQRLS